MDFTMWPLAVLTLAALISDKKMYGCLPGTKKVTIIMR